MKALLEQREVYANSERTRPWDKQGPTRSLCAHACFLVGSAVMRNHRETFGPGPVPGATFIQIIQGLRDADAAWKAIVWGARVGENKQA